MKRMSKWLARVCIAVLLLGTIGAVPARAAGASLKLETPDNKVQTYKYQEPQDFVLNITNTGDTELKDIKVSPKLKKQGDKWPFKTEYQSYEETLPSLSEGDTGNVKFTFTQRDDAGDGRYQLTFAYTALSEDNKLVEGEQSFYVNTTAKPQEKQEEKSDSGSADSRGNDGAELLADAGGFDNGGAVYSGGGSSGNGSVPRVIVTGFTTNPAEVKAGSDFTLTIHLKNTSKQTKVSNMLFDLQAPTEGNDEQTSAPAFLPTSGSNSIYLDGIAANGTADISMQLNAKADLVQKPYGINLSMKYEDSQASQIEAEASLSIPVKQNARFEFSEFEITPESVEVGSEANVSCNIYNLGRIKLYNVKAIFEGDDIEKEEVFLGNLEPGSSTAIDAMLEGKKVSEGEGKVKMTLSYEDEAGGVSTAEESFNLLVTEASADDVMMEGMMEEAEGSKLPILPIVIAVLVVIGIAVGVVLKKKKKARGLLEEEEGLLDELDGPSEDEQQ
ncbi:MAG: hypothetical protein Q4C52_10900 [Eubacteriales bacterium]|nr:hypothetical protein [Eubacteriales bacterium]